MGRLRALEEVQTELLIVSFLCNALPSSCSFLTISVQSCLAHYFFILALFASTIWTATQFQNQGLTGWSKSVSIFCSPLAYADLACPQDGSHLAPSHLDLLGLLLVLPFRQAVPHHPLAPPSFSEAEGVRPVSAAANVPSASATDEN